ncbi:MAG: (2Fe-2S)-binding protein [Hyphomicrobium sp.]|nr:(2Fe-2S)-binding protein [Hyphomicrobium sp.]
MDAIELHVNGQKFGVHADPDTPLLYVLRNDLGLKGTRAGCVEGQCLSCTVLIEGRPQTACMVPVGAVAGQNVETVESLVGEGASHPLIDSVLKEQAGQCGYCLAGILMRAKALLDREPAPSRSDIATALDGHLCRCGAHVRILRAIERATQAGSARA